MAGLAAELDLYVPRGTKPIGFEMKRTDSPKLTPSMKSALEDLKLERLFVVVPGSEIDSLHDKVTVLGLGRLTRLPGLLATASTRS